MRLLNTQTLKVDLFMGQTIPAYAALSHTWGDEEVSLQDMQSTPPRTAEGFRKVEEACRVARSDGYDYVWIDTCCIDKTSSAELSEAINSMFRWYQDADVCYAYLVDLPPETEAALGDALPTCKYFTRGWTLQELIAPQDVHFYDSTWALRGSRRALVDLISEITSIEIEVLLDADELYCVPVATKMSWASKRVTTRIEDIAYCLLGLFDINMPLLYGEGRKAFRRLQEEVMRKTNDLSLLAWVGGTPGEEIREIWARSPAEFSWLLLQRSSMRVYGQFNDEPEITSKGLRISTRLLEAKGPGTNGDRPPFHELVLILRCRVSPPPPGLDVDTGSSSVALGIRLRMFGPALFVRDVRGSATKQLVIVNHGVWVDNRYKYSRRDQVIWLQCEDSHLPFWILQDKTQTLPRRKFYREFRNYGLQSSLKPNIHFPADERFQTAPYPLFGEVWDSSNRTLIVGWITVRGWEAMIATISPVYGGQRVLVIFLELSHRSKVFILDESDPLGKRVLNARHADGDDEVGLFEDLRNKFAALLLVKPVIEGDMIGNPLRQVRGDMITSDKKWRVGAARNERVVRGISPTQAVSCIDFEITPVLATGASSVLRRAFDALK